MKEKLKQMGYKMQQSMIGRYGIDALYKALLVIYLILVVTGSALARVSRPVYTVLRDKWTFRKTHVFKKCPGCKAVLRLPRKKGKHTVNCPHCHKNFTVHVHG